jgi:nucleoside-diphosphate-sugar epimerase
MMPACLITGASGFLGHHLLSALFLEGSGKGEVIAAGRKCPEGCPIESFRRVDLVDDRVLKRVVAEVAPSLVFHLAGKTPPGDPDDFYGLNTLATVRLLDILRALDRRCRVVLVGSAAELGPVPVADLPIGEDYPCRPVDAYGLSKWLATAAGLAARPPLEVVVARVFNPIGPGLPTSQALGRFAIELARGTGPISLQVGDLEARRDFIDVRDVARALIALASGGRPGRIYNVGTGRSHRVGDGLDALIALSGRDVQVDADATLARMRGPADSRADVGRIAGEIGWSAAISWEESLKDLWDDAVARVRAGLTGQWPAV